MDREELLEFQVYQQGASGQVYGIGVTSYAKCGDN
jgi:hypothetical protein